MATSAGTAASDVRVEIDTDLLDSDIQDILDRVERDIDREYSTGADDFEDTQHRVDFEASLAAYRIGTGRDPRASRERVGDITIEYEANQIDRLRRRVNLLDPKDSFPAVGIKRDSNRRTGSAGRTL